MKWPWSLCRVVGRDDKAPLPRTPFELFVWKRCCVAWQNMVHLRSLELRKTLLFAPSFATATPRCRDAQGQQKRDDVSLYTLMPWRGLGCVYCFGFATTRERTSPPQRSHSTAPGRKQAKASHAPHQCEPDDEQNAAKTWLGGWVHWWQAAFLLWLSRCTWVSCTRGVGAKVASSKGLARKAATAQHRGR